MEQLLPLDKTEKKKYMETFRRNVEDYLYEHPNCDNGEILEHFGTPESIASSFLSGEDDSYISQQINATKFKKKVIITFIIVMVIMISLSLTYVVVDTYMTNHGYFDEEIGEPIQIE